MLPDIEEGPLGELWLVRHGETEWSLTGRHTGRTDIALTPRGEREAELLGRYLAGEQFSLVLTSPLRRALDTCRLAGYGTARIEPNLREWDYGQYEGLRTPDIRRQRPGWTVWDMGVPGGETIEQVADRVRRVIGEARGAGGKVALFGHGHSLRVLTACWLGLPPVNAKHFALGTTSVSILGYERETQVIASWNLRPVAFAGAAG